MTLQEYFKASREPRYSVLFAFPLWLMYEGFAALMTQSTYAGVRNGADVLLKTFFVALGGPRGVTVFGALLVVAGAVLVVADWRKSGAVRPKLFLGMFAESLLYAALLGTVVSTLTSLLLHPGLATVQGSEAAGVSQLGLNTQLVISLGAGLYEELLFRVLLVSGILALGVALGWKKSVAVTVAIVASALIFSGFHYVGSLGDTLTLSSFTFRAVAGLLLSGLYVSRGFGITAWAHALYDVGLSLLGVM